VSGYAVLGAVERILGRGGDADDVLREVVDALRAEGEFDWVGISFFEKGAFVLGPSSGEPSGEPARLPISYDGNVVAELGVVVSDLSAEDRALLERVAELLAPYCLVGWDTGGEAWAP
jgi:putative methionine-R-sulfoxide reductase with GAF domain